MAMIRIKRSYDARAVIRDAKSCEVLPPKGCRPWCPGEPRWALRASLVAAWSRVAAGEMRRAPVSGSRAAYSDRNRRGSVRIDAGAGMRMCDASRGGVDAIPHAARARRPKKCCVAGKLGGRCRSRANGLTSASSAGCWCGDEAGVSVGVNAGAACDAARRLFLPTRLVTHGRVTTLALRIAMSGAPFELASMRRGGRVRGGYCPNSGVAKRAMRTMDRGTSCDESSVSESCASRNGRRVARIDRQRWGCCLVRQKPPVAAGPTL